MANKEIPHEAHGHLSQRQHSRWQELKRRQFVILASGVLALAAVIIILIAGWYLSIYRPMHEVLIKVNETSFDMSYFIDKLTIQSRSLQQSLSSLPKDQFAQYYNQYFNQVAESLPKGIEQGELMRQAAAKLGITVNEADVDKQIKDYQLTENRAIRDTVRAQLLNDKLKADYFGKSVPVSAPQVNLQAMLLESEAQAVAVRARIEKGEKFTDLAKELSLDSATKSKNGELGWHSQQVLQQLMNTSVPADYAFGSPAGTLSQPRFDADYSKQIGYWIAKVNIKEGPDNADVMMMLLGSEDEAKAVKARLDKGDNFADIAKELSQLSGAKDNGGAYGIVTKDALPTLVGDWVFGPEGKVSAISAPIKDTTATTKGGYWLINVLEKSDNRTLDETERSTLIDNALTDWANNLWLDGSYKIEDFTDAEKLNYAISKVK